MTDLDRLERLLAEYNEFPHDPGDLIDAAIVALPALLATARRVSVLEEALRELSFATGRIHAGGLQPNLDRFEQAMIGAGLALHRAALEDRP